MRRHAAPEHDSLFGAGDQGKNRNNPFAAANELPPLDPLPPLEPLAALEPLPPLDPLPPLPPMDPPPRGSIAGPEEYPGEDYPASEIAGLVHADAGPSEVAAAEKIAPIRIPLRMRVLAWIREAGAAGLTGPEAGERYSAEKNERPSARREYAVRPRITELADNGFVAEAGGVREGAKVWIATAKRGDGSEVHVKPTRRAQRLRLSAEDLRLMPDAIRLGAGPGQVVRRRSDGQIFYLPGIASEDDHPGHFMRCGVAFEMLYEIQIPEVKP